MSGFWYLASPYTRYEHGPNSAHVRVCLEAMNLLLQDVKVFSPIAHFHWIANLGNVTPPPDHAFWMAADAPFIEAARGLIVLRLKGWADSDGVKQEMAAFALANKPIVYMDPGCIPLELRK